MFEVDFLKFGFDFGWQVEVEEAEVYLIDFAVINMKYLNFYELFLVVEVEEHFHLFQVLAYVVINFFIQPITNLVGKALSLYQLKDQVAALLLNEKVVVEAEEYFAYVMEVEVV